MKVNQISILGVVLVVLLTSLACGLPFSIKETNDEQEQMTDVDIGEVLVENGVVSLIQPTTIGEDCAVVVEIPAGAFDTDTSLKLVTLKTLPKEPDEGLSEIGPTVAIIKEGEQARSDEPMLVTLEFDPEGIKEAGEVLVGYYHEEYGWYLLSPEVVDLENGLLTFETYHFSTFAAFQADERTRISRFLDHSATEAYVRSLNGEQSNAAIELMVKEIMVEGAGIVENEVLELITKTVVKQLPYGSTAIALYDMDKDEILNITLETTLSVLGQLIAEDDSVLADITDSASTVGAFASAMGSFSAGDIDGGLETMADEILDNIPVIDKIKEIGEDVVEIYNEVINNVWFRPEIEKAFQVYKNGAEGGWFGYSVDAGNWDQLSAQMRGAFAKVRTDYIQAFCDSHGLDPATLTEEEHNRIGDEGMEKLHNQFDERLARQAEIEQIRATQEQLMEMFAEKGLLEEVIGTNPMYTGNEDLEMLMNRLMNMTAKVLQDTGRNEIITHSFDENIDEPGTRIYAQDVADLVWIWYVNQPNSEEAYQQALIDKGLIKDPNLIYGVEPQKVFCEGDYTYLFEAEGARCEYTFGFSVEFWNVGALGGPEYADAIFTIDNPNISPWNNCELNAVNPSVSTITFSGGPNGDFPSDFSGMTLSSGSTISFSTPPDSVLKASGECTVQNPEAFNGWTGP
jgi:hypothetical protein